MSTSGVIDGRSLLSSAISRVQNFSPRLAQTTVTVIVPDPTLPGSSAALVSARQKRKIFQSVGFDFRETGVSGIASLSPRREELVIIQRPLAAADVLPLFGRPVTDLEGVAPPGTAGELSGTAEAALRVLGGLPGEVRLKYTPEPTTAVVGAKGYFGSQVVRALERRGERILPIDLGDDLALLSKADVVVSAVGKPALIKPEFLCEKPLLLIDVGYFYDENTGIGTGDFDEAAYRRSRHFVPTPGGMGPLQILTLLERALRVLNIQGYVPWAVDLNET